MAFVFNFLLEQVPTILCHLLGKHLPSKLVGTQAIKTEGNDDADISSDSGEFDSIMDEAQVWFDGVDKKLLEVHTRSKESVVEVVGRGGLLTKTPLLSYRAIVKRRKHRLEQKQRAATSQDPEKKQVVEPAITSKDTIKPTSSVTDELALDCEMVECYGHKSVLARVSVVNLFGHPILDSYVAPPSKVTDYRTRYSGIRKKDLDNAPPFEQVQAEIAKLIKNKIVVGHAVHNDFEVLKLNHPNEYIRDTSKYYGRNYFLGKVPSLKKLSESVLGVKIQQGEHDSVQDAQATMKLYVTVREKWEDTMLKRAANGSNGSNNKKKKQKTKPKKKKIKAFFVETR